MLRDIISNFKNLTPYLQLQEPIFCLQLWQYIVIFAIFFISRLVIYVVLSLSLGRLFQAKSLSLAMHKIQRMHSYTLALLILTKFTFPLILELPAPNRRIYDVIETLNFVVAVLILFLAYRIIDAFFLYVRQSVPDHGKENLYFFPFLKKLAKTLVTVLGVVVLPRFFFVYDVSNIFGRISFNTTILTTGIAFATKDIIYNAISGFMIIVLKTINAGDYINIDGIIGTVTHIDFRSIRVQQDDGALVDVPSSYFNSKKLINYGNITREEFTMQVIDNLQSDSLNKFLVSFDNIVNEHPAMVASKCTAKLSSIEGNIFTIIFSLAFKPISERKNILYSYEIVNALKKSATNMSIKIKD